MNKLVNCLVHLFKIIYQTKNYAVSMPSTASSIEKVMGEMCKCLNTLYSASLAYCSWIVVATGTITEADRQEISNQHLQSRACISCSSSPASLGQEDGGISMQRDDIQSTALVNENEQSEECSESLVEDNPIAINEESIASDMHDEQTENVREDTYMDQQEYELDVNQLQQQIQQLKAFIAMVLEEDKANQKQGVSVEEEDDDDLHGYLAFLSQLEEADKLQAEKLAELQEANIRKGQQERRERQAWIERLCMENGLFLGDEGDGEEEEDESKQTEEKEGETMHDSRYAIVMRSLGKEISQLLSSVSHRRGEEGVKKEKDVEKTEDKSVCLHPMEERRGNDCDQAGKTRLAFSSPSQLKQPSSPSSHSKQHSSPSSQLKQPTKTIPNKIESPRQLDRQILASQERRDSRERIRSQDQYSRVLRSIEEMDEKEKAQQQSLRKQRHEYSKQLEEEKQREKQKLLERREKEKAERMKYLGEVQRRKEEERLQKEEKKRQWLEEKKRLEEEERKKKETEERRRKQEIDKRQRELLSSKPRESSRRDVHVTTSKISENRANQGKSDHPNSKKIHSSRDIRS